MEFTIDIRTSTYRTVIKPYGDMVAKNSLIFAGRMRTCDEPFVGDIVVDLSDTTAIDSHALGVLVYWWKRLKEEGREFTFVRPHQAIERKLQLTGLDQVFRVIDDAG
jgi:anti-anti-sigma factor